jgi:hypothetical protein
MNPNKTLLSCIKTMNLLVLKTYISFRMNNMSLILESNLEPRETSNKAIRCHLDRDVRPLSLNSFPHMKCHILLIKWFQISFIIHIPFLLE